MIAWIAIGVWAALAPGLNAAGPESLAVLRVDPPAAPGSLAPGIVAAGPILIASWLEPQDQAAAGRRRVFALKVSRWGGGEWSAPAEVARGDDFFANWADCPSVWEGGDGSLYAHWLRRSGPQAYAYDIALARSTDMGTTWRPLGLLHDDGTRTEHGFVSSVPAPAGAVAFWLDGRNTAGAAHEGGHGAGGAMTLRTARVDAGVHESVELDASVCDCCPTAAAMTARGPVVVYRDRSADEIRDISIVRRVEGAWTAPRPVHVDGWQMPACPVNGPAIASAGDDLLVTWFTGSDPAPRVLAALSRDGGAAFDVPIELDRAGAERAVTGRVAAVDDGRSGFVAAWVAGDGDRAGIYLRRLSADGELGPPVRAADTSSARASGMPRLVRLRDRLVLVWTVPGEAGGIAAGAIRLADLPGP